MAVVLHLPDVCEIEQLHGSELDETLRTLEITLRKVESAMAAVIDRSDRSGTYGIDGFRSVTSWSRAICNTSNPIASHRTRIARVLRDLPAVAEAYRVGDIGTAQVSKLAELHGNPRCREQLPASEELLLGFARRLWYRQFAHACDHWRRLADPDGAERTSDEVARSRNATIDIVGEQVVLAAQGGTLAGAEMQQIFERFCEAEFLTDWDAAKAALGDNAIVTAEQLDRTAAQRRFDALVAIFRRAAGSTKAAAAEPVVNIVCDADTFLHHLRKSIGEDVQRLDPTTVGSRRCEMIDGTPVDPRAAVAAALIGQVRRVIVDSSGRVTDLGRRRRLFVGAAREAVLLADQTCIWPGCDRPSERCQIDHSDSWAANHGVTKPSNGGPTCAVHNLHKERGYTVWRDPNGDWHLYRPDGTEVAPRSPDPPSAGRRQRAS